MLLTYSSITYSTIELVYPVFTFKILNTGPIILSHSLRLIIFGINTFQNSFFNVFFLFFFISSETVHNVLYRQCYFYDLISITCSFSSALSRPQVSSSGSLLFFSQLSNSGYLCPVPSCLIPVSINLFLVVQFRLPLIFFQLFSSGFL